MIHTQYPNRIEITHPDGPHRDQTIELPLSFSAAKRRMNRWRPTWPAKIAKGFTIRVVLADEVVETIAPEQDAADLDAIRDRVFVEALVASDRAARS